MKNHDIKKLSHLHYRLLEIINALDKENGCFATNNYLAKKINSNSTSISRAIRKLSNEGFIKINTVGPRRILQVNAQCKKELTTVYQSGNHSINKNKLKDNINIKEIKLNENDIALKIIDFEYQDKILIYSELKTSFLLKCPLYWDEYTIKSFAHLCNRLVKSFETRLNKFSEPERLKILNKILVLVLDFDFPFLKNNLPIGIVSKWNQIMSDKNFSNKLDSIIFDRFERNEDRFL